MEKSCTLNVRITFKGEESRIIEIMQEVLNMIGEQKDLTFISFDYNNPKDTK
jgi:hypothetical protein